MKVAGPDFKRIVLSPTGRTQEKVDSLPSKGESGGSKMNEFGRLQRLHQLKLIDWVSKFHLLKNFMVAPLCEKFQKNLLNSSEFNGP